MVYDCLIIGAGPAGLSVAMNLARLLHTAIVFDSNVYRNDGAPLIHNVLGFDHTDAKSFRSKTRNDIAQRYKSIEFEDTTIVKAQKLKTGLFQVVDEDNDVYTGRKLVLCVGIHDIMLDIPGFDDCWAKGIFNCLFCHAFEERGAASVGVIAGACVDPAMTLHAGRMALQFSKKLAIYTNGQDETAQQLLEIIGSDPDIEVDLRQIAKLQMVSSKSAAVKLTFSDDTEKVEGFLVSSNLVGINGPFVQQLGLEVCPSGEIRTRPPMLETSVPGVFAAGDCATTLRAIPQAAAHGALVSVAIAHQLQAEKRVQLSKGGAS